MSKKDISRRDFIMSASITRITSAVAMSGLAGISSGQEKKNELKGSAAKVPMRIFGKTKVPVSILSLGGIFDIAANQIVLKKAL